MENRFAPVRLKQMQAVVSRTNPNVARAVLQGDGGAIIHYIVADDFDNRTAFAESQNFVARLRIARSYPKIAVAVLINSADAGQRFSVRRGDSGKFTIFETTQTFVRSNPNAARRVFANRADVIVR